MAQYFDDFQSESLGASPADWTPTWSTLGIFSVASVGGSQQYRYDQNTNNSFAREASVYTALGVAADLKIRGEFTVIATLTNNIGLLALRANDAVEASREGYSLFLRDNLTLNRTLSGSDSSIATAAKSFSADTAYAYRFEVTGTNPVNIKVKIWDAASSEPGSWDIDFDDSDASRITTAGYAAVGGLGVGDYSFDNVGIGTNGDAAPTSASSGPSLDSADNITSEGDTATFALSGNSAAPTSATLNGTDVGTITDTGGGVYSYTAPLIADDDTADLVVSVDATTVSTVISYDNSYPRDQVSHGIPDSNSINVGNQYATSLAYEWKVVTDADSGVVTIDWDAMESADGLNDDIDTYATTVAEGSTTVTIGVFIPESGETIEFDRTITVSESGATVDNWPFGKGIRPAATQTWEWGGRHPMTNMRVRIYK